MGNRIDALTHDVHAHLDRRSVARPGNAAGDVATLLAGMAHEAGDAAPLRMAQRIREAQRCRCCGEPLRRVRTGDGAARS